MESHREFQLFIAAGVILLAASFLLQITPPPVRPAMTGVSPVAGTPTPVPAAGGLVGILPLTPSGGGGELNIFDVELSGNGIAPSTFAVAKGDGIQLNIRARGGTYDVNIPAFGFYVVVPAGRVAVGGFSVTKAGVFKFSCLRYCPPGGPGALAGTIIVSE
ncbi:MAG: hypothetical protein V1885_03285 [Candidatus Brennerbacteria bacterium]